MWPAHAQAPGTPPPPPYPGAPAYPPAPGYPAPAYSPAAGYPGYPPAPGTAYPPAPSTSTKAVIALVLAIVSWVACPIIPAIVALVLARQSDREIAASRGWVGGSGLNTASRIVSWLNIGLYGALIIGLGLVFLVLAVLSAATN